MKNKDKWSPSKFIYKKGRLIASRDPREVGIGSRLMTDIIASLYDTYISQYARGRLIDLGCGKVPLFEAYKEYVTDNICVDWENSLHKNEFLDYEFDLTKKLPFKDGEFNTIILSDVLEHIPHPEYLWNEMSRILSPNGKIIMNTPFYYRLHEIPHDYYRFTEFALRRFAEANSFKVLILKPVGGSLEILADILAKHFSEIPLIGRGLAVGITFLTRVFGKTRVGHKISDRTKSSFPLGYFMIAEKI